MRFLSGLIDIFFPKFCIQCHTYGSYLCTRCQSRITFFQTPICPGCMRHTLSLSTHPSCSRFSSLDGLFVLTPYEGTIKTYIKHLKYYGHSDMTKELASLLHTHLPEKLPHIDVVTSVPLHPSRQKIRGYNQSELIGRCLATALHIPYQHLLNKTSSTKPQASLTRKARLHNLSKSFAMAQDIKPTTRVLLTDDVMTTGTTLQECAKTLKTAGASHVFGIVICHGK